MPTNTPPVPLRRRTALTIAGFDPGSGAGITADLLTLARFGIFATSAITALTVQSTRGVRQVQPTDAVLLRDTLGELEADLPADGIKIGMLGTASTVRVVADFLRAARARRTVTVVLDPVLVSSSGLPLLDAAGLQVLVEELLPHIDGVTPNTAEAAQLSGLPCRTPHEAEQCAAAIAERYPNLVPIVTGGHFDSASDLVWHSGRATWLEGRQIDSRSTHGTGCAFSSALLAGHLMGRDWIGSAALAKEFVSSAIRTAEPRGAGNGPMNLLCGDSLRN